MTHPVRQNRIFFFVLVIGLAAQVSARTFQDRGIQVHAASGPLIETLPGKIVTLSIQVANTSPASARLEATVVLPRGWRAFRKEIPFAIPAGASDIRLVSFSIPAETPSDRYEVRYVLRDPSLPSTVAETAVAVVVSAVRQLELRLIELPRYVIAGDQYAALCLITNKGNVSSRLHLTPRSSSSFPVQLDSSVIHLRPNESRELRAFVQTNAEVAQKVQDVFEITATREGDSLVAARASGAVDVVPQVSEVEEQYVRFPLQARIRAAGEPTTKGVQVEIMGSGALSEGGKDRLDVLLRTPDIQDRSILGQRDEYKVSYVSGGFELSLGDRNFSLSPLTEYNRYAFGARGKASVAGLALGGFYNETRFLKPIQKELAGFVSYEVAEAANVGVNYLRKTDRTTSDIVTLQSISRPLRGTTVDLEYGRGYLGDVTDEAFSARVTGREPWIAYEGRYVWAGPRYTGYYKDLEFKTLSLNLMPWSGVRIEGYYREEERNLRRDTTLSLAPRERYYQVGAGYSDLLAVYYRFNHQDDLLPIPKYRRDEEMVQVRLGHNFSSFGVIGNADFGTTKDTVAGKKYPFQRFTLFTTFRPASAASIGVSVEYSKDQNLFTEETQQRLSGSLTAWLMLSSRTQVSLSAYGSRVPDSSKQSYYLFDLALEHTFPFGHRVTLRGRQSEFTPSFEPKELAYLFEYSIPIGVPLARITTAGQLRGRVIDSESGRSLPNVLIYASGYTAITDRDGEFFFPSLKPDRYYIQVDMASIGLNRVPSQPMPQEVTIQGGAESRLDLGVVRGASIAGTVLLFGFKDSVRTDTAQVSYVELGGHPNVVLELSNAIESHRRLTDNRGRFTFTGIRPGRWTLRVIEGNLPVNHIFERETLDLEVSPGGTLQATLKILPRRRRIQILQEGKLLVETKPVPERKPVIRQPAAPVPRQPERAVVAPLRPRPVPVAPEKVPDTSFVIVRLPADDGFTIQMSSLSSEERALREAAKLYQASGYETSVVKVVLPEMGIRYRVYVGRFSTRRIAELASEELRKKLQSR